MIFLKRKRDNDYKLVYNGHKRNKSAFITKTRVMHSLYCFLCGLMCT